MKYVTLQGIDELQAMLDKNESALLILTLQKTNDGMIWMTVFNYAETGIKRYTANNIKAAVKKFKDLLNQWLVQPLHRNEGALTSEELKKLLNEEK